MPMAEREMMGKRGRAYCESNFECNMLINRLEGWMQGLSKKNKGITPNPDKLEPERI